MDTNEERLLEYYNYWKESETNARKQGGKSNGFTLEECGRAAQAIEMTLEILEIKIEGINPP